jgi:hypothetical protein
VVDFLAEDSIDGWIESSVNWSAERDDDGVEEKDGADMVVCTAGNFPLCVRVGSVAICKKRC